MLLPDAAGLVSDEEEIAVKAFPFRETANCSTIGGWRGYSRDLADRSRAKGGNSDAPARVITMYARHNRLRA
jgi:hypothetical protein